MGNIWDAPKKNKKKERSERSRHSSLGRYIHALVYNEPLDYHDKGGKPPKTRAGREIQIVNTAPSDRKEQKKGVRKRMRIREEKHPPPPEPKIRSPAKRKGFKKNVKPPPQVANLDDQTEEEKAEKIPPSSELNERVEKATKRTVEKALPIKKKRLIFQPILMSGIQKRLLFCNPGDESIQLAHFAIV